MTCHPERSEGPPTPGNNSSLGNAPEKRSILIFYYNEATNNKIDTKLCIKIRTQPGVIHPWPLRGLEKHNKAIMKGVEIRLYGKEKPPGRDHHY